MKVRFTSATLLVAMLMALVAAPISAGAAAPAKSTASFPISTTLTNSAGQTVGTLTGTVSNLAVTSRNGQLQISGVLNGVATIAGRTVNIVNQAFTTTLAASGSCTILHLTLGPIDLNLLGLMVHTNQIVLDITAQSGPGNLLGNLLCAVAHLLDSNAANTALANLLNKILAQL